MKRKTVETWKNSVYLLEHPPFKGVEYEIEISFEATAHKWENFGKEAHDEDSIEYVSSPRTCFSSFEDFPGEEDVEIEICEPINLKPSNGYLEYSLTWGILDECN